MNVHPGSPTARKGPPVFLDMDQQALDDAYDQEIWAPNRALIVRAPQGRERAGAGDPRRAATRGLRAERDRAARHLRLRHQRRAGQRVRPRRRLAAQRGGRLCAAGRAAGARRRALRRSSTSSTSIRPSGDLFPMYEQVRRALAWVWRNAASFGGDRDRHLCLGAFVRLASVRRGADARLARGGPAARRLSRARCC